MRRLGFLLIAVALVACGGVTPTATPTEMPGPTPGDTLPALGPEATGEVVELGEGDAHGTRWRYAVYPSAEGWCLQLELDELAGVSCGIEEPEEGSAFRNVNHTDAAAAGDRVAAVEGVASRDTATVWVIADGGRGRRIPALLAPLDHAGIDAQAFLAVLPPDMNATHLQAVALNGQILETYELP